MKASKVALCLSRDTWWTLSYCLLKSVYECFRKTQSTLQLYVKGKSVPNFFLTSGRFKLTHKIQYLLYTSCSHILTWKKYCSWGGKTVVDIISFIDCRFYRILQHHIYKIGEALTLPVWGNTMPGSKQGVYKTPRFSLQHTMGLSFVNKNKNSLQFAYYFKAHEIN